MLVKHHSTNWHLCVGGTDLRRKRLFSALTLLDTCLVAIDMLFPKLLKYFLFVSDLLFTMG